MPSRLSPRLRLRKLEMWACLKPVCLCQTEAGEIAFLNALPKSISEVVLQNSEFHRRE